MTVKWLAGLRLALPQKSTAQLIKGICAETTDRKVVPKTRLTPSLAISPIETEEEPPNENEGGRIGNTAPRVFGYPEVRLELIMRDHVGDLVADGFDLALRFGDPPGGSLIARKLIETRILTVASPEFVAATAARSTRPKSRSYVASTSTMRRMHDHSIGSFVKVAKLCLLNRRPA